MLPERDIRVESRQNYPVPEIFKVAQTGDVALVKEELLRNRRDPELIYLGFRLLLQQGEAGKNAIAELRKAGGTIAEIASTITNGNESYEDVEQELMPDRFKAILDYKKLVLHDDSVLVEILEEAKSAGVVSRDYSLQELILKIQKDSLETIEKYPHLEETLENHLVAFNSTFGINEPTYLELLSPEEILKLRMQTNAPSLLLLGSLGKYSAREFAKFGKKLDRRSHNHVVEIKDKQVKLIQPYQGENNLCLVQGNALALPYRADSMDQVYEDHLLDNLHAKSKRNTRLATPEQITAIFTEVSRVLRPGGSFCLIEHGYKEDPMTINDRVKYISDMAEARELICLIAQKQGFLVKANHNKELFYIFLANRTSARISNNGIAQYDAPLFAMDMIALRLVKQ
ncbi:MAG: methyltransferase domain-containing protein [Patescibacteria group bacterium]|jgi:SAM-dependent methyltransferase